MSFHKRRLPSLEKLREELEGKDSKKLLQTYMKSDALIGPADSIDYLLAKLEQANTKKKKKK